MNGKVGIFPSTFVLAPQASTNVPQRRALYNYVAQEVNELSFKEGDVINVLEKKEEQGWWKGELNGTAGLFPSNYTEDVK